MLQTPSGLVQDLDALLILGQKPISKASFKEL